MFVYNRYASKRNKAGCKMIARNFLIAISLILTSIFSTKAQFMEKSNYSGRGVPYFEAEIFKTFVKDSILNRIYIYNEILH